MTIAIAGRPVGEGAPVYIIAEAGSNHDGDFDQALALIEMAANAGADAVKFQLFHAESLYPENCGVVDLADGPQDFFALMQQLEMPREWIPGLADAGTRHGVSVLYTPFDLAAVDLLVAHAAPAMKIASPELTHLPLLRHIARTGCPVILSTGMSTLADVEESVATLTDSGCRDVALLHCVTAYPCPPEFSNLDVIPVLSSAFGVPVGLSDHTLDPVAAPLVATAVGATVIEKHVTLSRSLDGPDHSFAIEPDELSDLVTAVRTLEQVDPAARLDAAVDQLGAPAVEQLRGSPRKAVTGVEAELAACDRRSLHASTDIAVGDTLTSNNMAVLRGERNLRPGLHPRHWAQVEHAVTRRPIAAGQGIEWDDVIERRS